MVVHLPSGWSSIILGHLLFLFGDSLLVRARVVPALLVLLARVDGVDGVLVRVVLVEQQDGVARKVVLAVLILSRIVAAAYKLYEALFHIRIGAGLVLVRRVRGARGNAILISSRSRLFELLWSLADIMAMPALFSPRHHGHARTGAAGSPSWPWQEGCWHG